MKSSCGCVFGRRGFHNKQYYFHHFVLQHVVFYSTFMFSIFSFQKLCLGVLWLISHFNVSFFNMITMNQSTWLKLLASGIFFYKHVQSIPEGPALHTNKKSIFQFVFWIIRRKKHQCAYFFCLTNKDGLHNFYESYNNLWHLVNYTT